MESERTVQQVVGRYLAALPLPYRRRLLRLGWKLSLPFRRDVGFGLEPILEQRLRGGRRGARQIAVEHDFHDYLQQLEWLASATRSVDAMVAETHRTRVSDHHLAQRIADSGQPVILAPMHMGIFPLGVSYMLWRYFNGRRLLVLRAREDHAINNLAMDRLKAVASEIRILNTRNQAEFMDAMRYARQGAVVVSLIDLPRSYGVAAPVSLFGMPSAIALGLDSMARMLKAVVMPMAVHSHLDGDEIILGQPFEVADTSPAARAELAADLARQIEAFIRPQPAQWHMWTRLDEFDLDPAEGEEGEGARDATA
jgi:phosphatidylinositol dimannoside acyltransferase